MIDADYFRTFGFLVLRQFFDPGPLATEIDRVLNEGLVSLPEVAGHERRFQFVPMMTSTTPVSYDVERYLSYGHDWRISGRPAVARLEALGVYDLAATQESFMRKKRQT